jgi:hypothetical protein
MNIILYKTEVKIAKLLNHEQKINLKVRQLISWSVQFFLFCFISLCVAKQPIDNLFEQKIYILRTAMFTANRKQH